MTGIRSDGKDDKSEVGGILTFQALAILSVITVHCKKPGQKKSITKQAGCSANGFSTVQSTSILKLKRSENHIPTSTV